MNLYLASRVLVREHFPDVGMSSHTETKESFLSFRAKCFICSVAMLSKPIALPGFSVEMPSSSSSMVKGLVKPGLWLHFIRLSLCLFGTFLSILPFKSNWWAIWFAVTFGWQGALAGRGLSLGHRSLPMIDTSFRGQESWWLSIQSSTAAPSLLVSL